MFAKLPGKAILPICCLAAWPFLLASAQVDEAEATEAEATEAEGLQCIACVTQTSTEEAPEADVIGDSTVPCAFPADFPEPEKWTFSLESCKFGCMTQYSRSMGGWKVIRSCQASQFCKPPWERKTLEETSAKRFCCDANGCNSHDLSGTEIAVPKSRALALQESSQATSVPAGTNALLGPVFVARIVDEI